MRPLLIGVGNWPPSTTLHAQSTLLTTNIRKRVGEEAETLGIIFHVHKIPHILVNITSEPIGSMDMVNGFSGVHRMIYSGLLDTAATSFVYTEARRQFYDMSHPFTMTQGQFIVANVQRTSMLHDIYRILANYHWSFIVFLILSVLLLLVTMQMYQSLLQPKRRSLWHYVRFIVSYGDVEHEIIDEQSI